MKTRSARDKYALYFSSIRYLEGLGNITGGYQKKNLSSHPHPEMFLRRMRDFLDLLGNPENGFKYVHITGTAGKGSVATAVHSELLRAGKRAGLFTSPFTVSTIEKIQVGEKYIDPLVFARITDEIKPQVDIMIKSGRYGPPSYFEMILAIALIYFRKERCEYVILEAGLGGRYDATNVIKSPLVTAVTNIGPDHTNILGKKMSDIARDKSGIIKKKSKFFTAEEDKGMRKIFLKACEEAGAEYHSVDVKGLDYLARNSFLVGNICGALGIAGSLKEAMSKAPSLPARFEVVRKRPFIIIDGAHNPSKMKSTVYNLMKMKYERLFLVIAISRDKDWKNMMRIVSPHADEIYVTRFSVPGRQSVDPKILLKGAIKYCGKTCKVHLFSDPVEAFGAAKGKLSEKDALLVTGSFYLAGDIRSLYCPEIRILEERNPSVGKI